MISKTTIDARLVGSYGLGSEAMVNTKYKTMVKKIRLVAIQLPPNSKDHVKKIEEELELRETRKIGDNFIEETLTKVKIRGGEFLNKPKNKKIQDMIFKHDKVFTSSLDKIGCVNSKVIISMVIFTIPYIL